MNQPMVVSVEGLVGELCWYYAKVNCSLIKLECGFNSS